MAACLTVSQTGERSGDSMEFTPPPLVRTVASCGCGFRARARWSIGPFRSHINGAPATEVNWSSPGVLPLDLDPRRRRRGDGPPRDRSAATPSRSMKTSLVVAPVPQRLERVAGIPEAAEAPSQGRGFLRV